MAFTTEFVMGAGGAGGAEVEEIPVSTTGSGGNSSSPNVYPLATVDAGGGAWVWVEGAISPGSTTSTGGPQLQVGSRTYTGVTNRIGGGGYFTGTVNVSMLSRTFSASTFTGTVYVTRM